MTSQVQLCFLRISLPQHGALTASGDADNTTARGLFHAHDTCPLLRLLCAPPRGLLPIGKPSAKVSCCRYDLAREDVINEVALSRVCQDKNSWEWLFLPEQATCTQPSLGVKIAVKFTPDNSTTLWRHVQLLCKDAKTTEGNGFS